MKTLKRVEVTFKKLEYLPYVSDLQENVIYISDTYMVSKHLCLCGCGQLTVMPLGKGQWNYQINTNNKISMQPSVGNFQLPCKSHYIISKGGANFARPLDFFARDIEMG